MKSVLNMLSVVVFLVVFSCFGYSQTDPPKSTSRVTVKYDKGKDMTQVSLKPFKIDRYDQEKQMGGNFKPHQMEFDAWFSYKGQATGPIQEVTFRFHCTSNTYIFLHGQEVIVAIDREIKDKDRGFSLGMSEYRSESPKFNTVYEENMTLKVPVDALRKFAEAQTLELYLGPYAYKFTPKQLDAVKEFAGFLPPKP